MSWGGHGRRRDRLGEVGAGDLVLVLGLGLAGSDAAGSEEHERSKFLPLPLG